jgi:hypothetical protein
VEKNHTLMTGGMLRLEFLSAEDTGICDCCGNTSRIVRGLAYQDDICVAAYLVHWTKTHVFEHGANLDLIMGRWGEGAQPDEREAVSLEYRLTETGPAVRVIDAHDRDVAKSSLVGRALARSDVLGTPKADTAFAVADAVLALDERVVELLGDYRISFPN